MLYLTWSEILRAFLCNSQLATVLFPVRSGALGQSWGGRWGRKRPSPFALVAPGTHGSRNHVTKSRWQHLSSCLPLSAQSVRRILLTLSCRVSVSAMGTFVIACAAVPPTHPSVTERHHWRCCKCRHLYMSAQQKPRTLHPCFS